MQIGLGRAGWIPGLSRARMLQDSSECSASRASRIQWKVDFDPCLPPQVKGVGGKRCAWLTVRVGLGGHLPIPHKLRASTHPAPPFHPPTHPSSPWSHPPTRSPGVCGSTAVARAGAAERLLWTGSCGGWGKAEGEWHDVSDTGGERE